MIKYRMALVALTTLITAATCRGLSEEGRQKLIEDLVRVESNGRSNLVGDAGKAYGCLQIHKEMVTDANRILGHGAYTHEQMFDPTAAKSLAAVVLGHYNAYILRVTGREATAKELAFIWNGGGSSWKRVNAPKADSKQTNLERYWSKVSRR
jgi:hypothetical protein